MDSERSEQDWVEANAQRINDALSRPVVREELFRLLGDDPNPDAVREALAREVARLRLKWRPGS
jgi:hypothetical protein